MMNLHRVEISTQVATGAIAVWSATAPAGTKPVALSSCRIVSVLLHLPPYSPGLNPMENVWDYLRQNKLSPLVWNRSHEIFDACETAWNWLIADPARITPIGTRPNRNQAPGMRQLFGKLTINRSHICRPRRYYEFAI